MARHHRRLAQEIADMTVNRIVPRSPGRIEAGLEHAIALRPIACHPGQRRIGEHRLVLASRRRRGVLGRQLAMNFIDIGDHVEDEVGSSTGRDPVAPSLVIRVSLPAGVNGAGSGICPAPARPRRRSAPWPGERLRSGYGAAENTISVLIQKHAI